MEGPRCQARHQDTARLQQPMVRSGQGVAERGPNEAVLHRSIRPARWAASHRHTDRSYRTSPGRHDEVLGYGQHSATVRDMSHEEISSGQAVMSASEATG